MDALTQNEWLIIAAGGLALLYGLIVGKKILSADTGTKKMVEISSAIQEGARAYLNRQYQTIALVYKRNYLLLPQGFRKLQ